MLIRTASEKKRKIYDDGLYPPKEDLMDSGKEKLFVVGIEARQKTAEQCSVPVVKAVDVRGLAVCVADDNTRQFFREPQVNEKR